MKLTQLTLTTFLFSCALSGALKFVGISIGFPFIHLLPKLALAGVTLLPYFRLEASRKQWLILALFVLLCVAGILGGMPVRQPLFGFWVLLPLIFGLTQPSIVLSAQTRNALVYVLALSLVGEAVNHFHAMPWESMTISYGDYTSTVARDWTDNSVKRLAGFATSSIDLSLIIAVASCALLTSQRRVSVRTVVLLISVVAILATTMKTAAAAFAFAALPLWMNSRLLRRVTGLAAIGATVTATLAPFIAWAAPGMIRALEQDLMKGRETLQMRLDVVWPAVLDYVQSLHVSVFGTGLGGLGAANELGKRPFDYAFVDNMYLYLLSVGGILGAFLILLLLIKLARRTLSLRAMPLDMAGSMLVFFSIYGSSQVAIETSIGALFFGAGLAAVIPMRVRRRDTTFARHDAGGPLPYALAKQAA